MMFDSFGSFGTNNESQGVPYGGGLLIPVSVNDVVHVTSADLANGTSHTGPVWTKNGTVAFVAATGSNPKRGGVGTFSAGNGYSLAHPTPIDFTGTPQCTMTMVLKINAAADNGIFVSVGDILGVGNGWCTFNWSSGGGTADFFIAPSETDIFLTPLNTGLNVITWGINGAGLGIIGVNGSSNSGVDMGPIVAPTTGATIGDITGREFNGLIYEFAATTDPCDATAISTINAAVVANY